MDCDSEVVRKSDRKAVCTSLESKTRVLGQADLHRSQFSPFDNSLVRSSDEHSAQGEFISAFIIEVTLTYVPRVTGVSVGPVISLLEKDKSSGFIVS